MRPTRVLLALALLIPGAARAGELPWLRVEGMRVVVGRTKR